MLFAGRDLGDETTSEYVTDITKQTEAALRESEERFIGLRVENGSRVRAVPDRHLGECDELESRSRAPV
jgi:hypothetical protein